MQLPGRTGRAQFVHGLEQRSARIARAQFVHELERGTERIVHNRARARIRQTKVGIDSRIQSMRPVPVLARARHAVKGPRHNQVVDRIGKSA